jgi:hypothetical protein
VLLSALVNGRHLRTLADESELEQMSADDSPTVLKTVFLTSAAVQRRARMMKNQQLGSVDGR